MNLSTCEGSLETYKEDLKICEMDLTQAQMFPATGQTRCWDVIGGEIPCAGTGLDGDIRSGAPLSYTVNSDGTVTDNNTRLMWELKVVVGGLVDCIQDLHAANATCSWTEATGAWINAVNAEGDTGFAGYDDWRLPNVKELQSIVDYGKSDPAISPVFNNAQSASYWSSTNLVNGNSLNQAWGVSFLDGVSTPGFKTISRRHVRAVRGPVHGP